VPRFRRHVGPISLWHHLSWGLAFTPLVFVVLMSVDLTAALAVALAFAPELVAAAAVLALLFLLGRRVVQSLRRKPEVGEDRG
jgi:membrane protein implicated in regulation of membrane protease activity